MSRPQFPHLSMGFGQSWLFRPATSLQGKLSQGAGGPGGRVPVPVLPPGGAEGGDAHEDKAGPCQPNLRAAGVCSGCSPRSCPDAIPTAPLRFNRAQLASCLSPNLLRFLCAFLEMLPSVLSLATTHPSPAHLFSLLILCLIHPLLSIAAATPTSGCSSLVSSPNNSNFTALPTGPSDLMTTPPHGSWGISYSKLGSLGLHRNLLGNFLTSQVPFPRGCGAMGLRCGLGM